MLITSLENDRIKGYVKLKDKKYRKKSKTFIVEGFHSVLEAYKSGNIIELILEKDEVLPFNVPTIYVTKEIINKISYLETPSNIMALCKTKDEDIKLGNKILLLDNVQDPGNLGAIIRSAAAFNVDTIILSPDTVDLYNPKVVPIFIKDLSNIIDEIKLNEIPVYGTRVEYGEDVVNLKEKDKNRYALVMGNEGSGIREEILEKCDKSLFINMNDKVESLNVAVATSILLYELNK